MICLTGFKPEIKDWTPDDKERLRRLVCLQCGGSWKEEGKEGEANDRCLHVLKGTLLYRAVGSVFSESRVSQPEVARRLCLPRRAFSDFHGVS